MFPNTVADDAEHPHIPHYIILDNKFGTSDVHFSVRWYTKAGC